MIISKVVEGNGGQNKGEVSEDNSHEYQTANELFELMAKDQHFDTEEVERLTTRDLILLYKNIDLGTRLMSDASEIKIRKPNQHVESVIHNDGNESDGSDKTDVSDIHSNLDVRNVCMINNERLDLLNSHTQETFGNTLCHKYGNLEMQSSNLASEYDKHFLFHDPYIKQQLQSLKVLSTSTNDLVNSVNALAPSTLLDYICCKRLEDNYNFYMENIIRYVQHTIEQLKRISNGDYLTDKAKEKWREVEYRENENHRNTKVLATSTSIPLHVECKFGGAKTTWDDIVRSEVDIRSLSKILEKKIVLEIPKLVCNSYTFLSKCCADNLVISCKTENNPVEETNESRVNVIFQLQRSETGQVMSNINSIMILQTKAPLQRTEETLVANQILPLLALPCKETIHEQKVSECSTESNEKDGVIEHADGNEVVDIKDAQDENEVDVINECACNNNELDNTNINPVDIDSHCGHTRNFNESLNITELNEEEYLDCDAYEYDETDYMNTTSYQESTDSSDVYKEILDNIADCKSTHKNEASIDIILPNDLRITMQKITKQGPLSEESEDLLQSLPRKKSPARVRIKSPYENQSYFIEEKKRKKLIEIRERREKIKKALAEKCKVTKHKYGKGAVMPQSSNSVTKLSITNKSFYDSIYGQNRNAIKESKPSKVSTEKPMVKREVLKVSLPCVGEDLDSQSSIATTEEKKYVNRSYYLDDTETEMMYLNMNKQQKDGKSFSTSDSVVSNNFPVNLLAHDVNIEHTEINENNKKSALIGIPNKEIHDTSNQQNWLIHDIVPSNTPDEKESVCSKSDTKRRTSSVECKKSIDKIYDLLNKLGNTQEIDCKLKSKFTANIPDNNIIIDTSSTCQGSDSGTSLKHHASSSNDSYFSIEKANHHEIPKHTYGLKKELANPITNSPKVIIHSKEKDKKKERKRSVGSPVIKVPENPLKAISQLLHNIENVQKNKHTNATDRKVTKKPETSTVAKSHIRQNVTFRARLDQHKEVLDRYARVSSAKDKQKRHVIDIPKIPFQQSPIEEKHDKVVKKKINDIIDEVKEARGEAVRGPKFYSRLNTLAQPKRVYVQAHSAEYQTKYGRNLMADRLQRLAASPPTERNGSAHSKTKPKRSIEPTSTVTIKLPAQGPQLGKPQSSVSNKPDIKEVQCQPGRTGSSFKHNVPESPDTLIRKMVAVESYVKHHYGRSTSTDGLVTESSQMSRTSPSPEIDLASMASSALSEISKEVENKLYSIIENMKMSTQKNQILENLPECHESSTKLSKENIEDNHSVIKKMSYDESENSEDISVNMFDNTKIVVSKDGRDEEDSKNKFEVETLKYDIQPFKSLTDLEKLEQIINRRLPSGAFQKRLRIKNITLTPKHSMQQIFVLQSGDTASLVLKTTHSQTEQKKNETFAELSTLSALSTAHLNWNFAQIPMQIATVGYVVPKYNSSHYTPSLVQLFEKVAKLSGTKSTLAIPITKYDKDSQCHDSGRLQAREKEEKKSSSGKTNLVMSNQALCSEATITTEAVFNIENVSKPTLDTIPDPPTHNSFEDKTKETDKSDQKSEIDYTKSLDVLVGLLTEIQKITTCQTNLTKPDRDLDGSQDCTELEKILCNTEAIENSNSPCNLISFTSLDRLRQLESSQSQGSIYSLYLSDSEKKEISSRINLIPELKGNLRNPRCVDQSVGIDVEKQCIDRFTDVPSMIFPVSISFGTHVSDSMLGSGQTMFSCVELRSVYSDKSDSHDNTNSPQLMISEETTKMEDVPDRIVDCSQIIYSGKPAPPGMSKILKYNIDIVKIYHRTKKDIPVWKNAKSAKSHNFCLNNSNFDPIMKVKRDVLVTFYSILVFTVFAALSFPEFMYRL